MNTKEEKLISLAKAAINHGLFCDQNIIETYWNNLNEYFEDVYGHSLKEINELLNKSSARYK